ncbi:MAG: CDP-alcohol phosphatidyltransferase family protein [Anaerolineaceae bacterium]
MTDKSDAQKPDSLSDFLRKIFKNVLNPIGSFLNKLGITPNMMTLLGLVGNIFAAVFLTNGKFVTGGIIILALGPFDALDGTMARLRGEPTRFGGFVDSVTDRYSELFILGGVLIYFLHQQNDTAVILTYLSAAGSVLVSYIRARAESLGFDAKVGLMTRVERVIILSVFFILNLPEVALWILAIFTNFTALQRIWHVRKLAIASQK